MNKIINNNMTISSSSTRKLPKTSPTNTKLKLLRTVALFIMAILLHVPIYYTLSYYKIMAPVLKQDTEDGASPHVGISNNADTNFTQLVAIENHDILPKNSSIISTAPLFYHISPGSSGSRTLYHAACRMGFPSVHHISFCISRTRGINGVPDNVVQGLRAHYKIMRLYEMAIGCCRLYQKGMIDVVDGRVILTKKTNKTSSSSVGEDLCNKPLDDWRNDIYSHLQTLIQSGLVGLFDSPYAYLADQVLELSNEWRVIRPIISITNREAKGWAASRLKHQILMCRTEYSYKQMGASEFDIFGCIDRAFRASSLLHNDKKDKSTKQTQPALHFWNVFLYRTYNDGPIEDQTLLNGMARQMEHFQKVYTPLAVYAPDMFGMNKVNKTKSEPITDKQFEVDIRTYILGHGRDVPNINGVGKYQSIWRDSYKPKSISCRGRVKWHMQNDSLVEFYHLPKTCEVSSTPTIPLIPAETRGNKEEAQ